VQERQAQHQDQGQAPQPVLSWTMTTDHLKDAHTSRASFRGILDPAESRQATFRISGDPHPDLEPADDEC
jgi:hypothetical protein